MDAETTFRIASALLFSALVGATIYLVTTDPPRRSHRWPPIVAICGSGTGAGKSTARDILCRLVGRRRVTALSFADPLRQCASALTGIPVEVLRTEAGKKTYLKDYGMTAGALLQRLGTEAIRDNLHVNAFVYAAERKIEEALGVNSIVIFDDLRFPNELELVRDLKGTVIYIDRPSQTGGDGRDHKHRSEGAISRADADIVIDNAGTCDELEDTLALALGFKEH